MAVNKGEHDQIFVFDFGGQYSHMIARRIRDLGVYAEVVASDLPAERVAQNKSIHGIILSGGARSVYEKKAPRFDKDILGLRVPILGICYGCQLIARTLGGRVRRAKAGEYGLTELEIIGHRKLFKGFGKATRVWMNHRDVVESVPRFMVPVAVTRDTKIAAYEHSSRPIFGVQFHPEVSHTYRGEEIIKNFVIRVCRCERTWSSRFMAHSISQEVARVIGQERAVIGLSGGVDSSCAATLVGRVIGKNLTAIYVDTGLMRHDDTTFVRRAFANLPVKLKVVFASREFFWALRGKLDPEEKRKIIGALFAKIFTREARKTRAQFLVQGTIYSDRIESGITKHSARIKSHHNVGGLPKNLGLKVYEPLRDLYKDEVRRLAKVAGLPNEIITRQVFPGPGLAVRIIGEVKPRRVSIVRRASRIINEELEKTEFWPRIWMSFAVLLPIKSVGVQGDARSYKYPIVVRIVESRDAMTANYSKIPHAILERIATRIVNEVREVNRVVYDITNKPPATMEWL